MSYRLTHFNTHEQKRITFSLTLVHKLNKIILKGFEASASSAVDDSIFLGWHCIIFQENGIFKIILHVIDSERFLGQRKATLKNVHCCKDLLSYSTCCNYKWRKNFLMNSTQQKTTVIYKRIKLPYSYNVSNIFHVRFCWCCLMWC